jgi:Mn2+/Fe2+ NRAMP family transporter
MRFDFGSEFTLDDISMSTLKTQKVKNYGINNRVHEAPTFYSLFTGLIGLGAIAVLVLSETKQVPIILLSQVANGILLPFVLIFMLRLCNREDLMGKHRNSRTFNIIAWVTCVVMLVLTLLWMIMALFPKYARS